MASDKTGMGLFQYLSDKQKKFTLGKPGSSLSVRVATWNCNIFTSSDMMWAAAPFCSFLFSWLLALMMSDSLWVKSS